MLLLLITSWSIKSYQSLRCIKYLHVINKMPRLAIYIDQESFADKVKHFKTMFLQADSPLRFADIIIRNFQKQLSNSVGKKFSEKARQIYRRAPMPKCDFNKLRHGCSSVNLLYIFGKPFPKNISGGLLLNFQKKKKNLKINLKIFSTNSIISPMKAENRLQRRQIFHFH